MPRIESIKDRYNPYNYIYVFHYKRDNVEYEKRCMPNEWFSGDSTDTTFRCVTTAKNLGFNEEKPVFYDSFEEVLTSLPELLERVDVVSQRGVVVRTFYHVRNPR